MKITGADGYSPEMIRDEVARGGRMVIYVYCVSILIMTFKRGTSIHFVRAGQNPVMRGLPFTFVTLLFGWWGFPWGPIYSFECLYKNLTGGIDVTDDVLNAILPAGSTSSHQSLPPRAPRKPVTARQILIGLGAVCAVFIGIYAIICDSAGRHMQVAVLNGRPARTSYTINGETVSVAPGGYQLITQPQGEFTIDASPGRSAETFRLETPFWSRPFEGRVAVINPDRNALFYRYHVIYRADNATGENHGQPTDYTLYANQSHYLLEKPDYAFVEAPKRIDMPTGKSFDSKTRLTVIAPSGLDERIALVAENLGDDAAKTYALNLSQTHGDDDSVLTAATISLKPAVAFALFESRLDERPLLIEWHRYYQNLAERLHPELDLRARYAALATAEPDNGSLHYLLGRIEPDSTTARQDYDKALAAPQPCVHAHLGLGYLDNSAGDFSASLAHYDEAVRQGLSIESVLTARRQTLLALRRYDVLLADVRQRRAANPAGLALAAEEIQYTLALTPNPDAARPIIETALARNAKDSTTDDKTRMRAYLDSTAAYALGDQAAFARAAELIGGPVYMFQASVSRGDHRSGKLALKDTPQLPSDYLFILHLVASRNGDAKAADAYWTEAVTALSKEGISESQIAEQLAGHAPINADMLRTVAIQPAKKSLIFASLGLHDPARRDNYYTWASQNNFNPVFPHLLIDSVIKSTPAKTTF
jgi:hypothetical protein